LTWRCRDRQSPAMLGLLARVATVFAALVAGLPAQQERDGRAARGDELCARCKTTGRIANPALDEDALERERDCLFCSYRIDRDPAGRGLEFVPCKGCKSPSLEAKARSEFEARAKAADEWLAGRRKIDADLAARNKLIHVETKHFQLTFGLDKVVLENRTVLDPHAAAHLYAQRLEEHYAWILATIGYDDEQARNKVHQVYLMNDLRTLMKAAQLYAHLQTDRQARAVGDPSIIVTWRDKTNFKTDASFHQHVVHHVTHNVIGVYYLMAWMAENAGWLEEGLANLAEMERFQKSGNSCNVEGSEEDMSDADWQPVVRKLAAGGKTRPFADWMNKRSDLLNAEEHYLAFSYTDFLWKRKPEALPLLIKGLKERKEQRDLLRDLYGLSPLTIDEAWKTFVLETYRVKPLVGG
jgi:hypothetical protein